MAKATPSLGAVTWHRLAWAVEDRLAEKAGSSNELRIATGDAVDELARRGVPVNEAVGIVRAIVLRLAGVSVNDPRGPSSRRVEGDGIVARAS
jgi:hypothetical protein